MNPKNRINVTPETQQTNWNADTVMPGVPLSPPSPSPLKRGAARLLALGVGVPLMRLLEGSGQLPRLQKRIYLGQQRPDKLRAFFGAYRPTAHDVLVCAYVKSGTNWMLHLAVQVAYRGQAEFEFLHQLVAWPDALPSFGFPPLDAPSWPYSPTTGLRVIKTHLPAAYVPTTQPARIIAVVRDPKDVFVSSYHFFRATMLGPMMPSVSGWLDSFLSPAFLGGLWAEHVCGYWRQRHQKNVLFITFGEMKADLPGVVRRVAALLEVELTEAEVATVVHKCSFDYMRQINHKFSPPAAVLPPWVAGEMNMIRRGERGASGAMLTAVQQQRIDDYWRQELKRLNCDFPYDEKFITKEK